MNNVYFANEGMTSTTANFYANIAKELQNAATERLNSVKFFKTSVAVIGSREKQLMEAGNESLDFIPNDLKTLAEMNAFCAWVREAIKEKESQMTTVNRGSIETWAKAMGIELPVMPVSKEAPLAFGREAPRVGKQGEKRGSTLRLPRGGSRRFSYGSRFLRYRRDSVRRSFERP